MNKKKLEPITVVTPPDKLITQGASVLVVDKDIDLIYSQIQNYNEHITVYYVNNTTNFNWLVSVYEYCDICILNTNFNDLYTGPDYDKNKKRILDKSEIVDANFITTSPDVLNFLPKKIQNYFIPNPADSSFETLNNFKKNCNMDVFFALSHGVHRGVLKTGKFDDRARFIRKLMNITKDVKFDVYGLDKVQPIWADHYFKSISNSKMGLNLSRGEPIKYYSSDRITQIIGNGLVTLIDEKTMFRDFFNDNEMVFYKNIENLSELISKLARDEKKRKRIGQKGKEKYLRYFNSNLVAEFIINKTFDRKSKSKFIWNN